MEAAQVQAAPAEAVALPGRPRPPAFIWVPAAFVAAAMVLPLAYLMLRTFGSGTEALDLLFKLRTLEILIRSLALVVVVTSVCIFLAVPLAWLTVRTDLPFRRAFSVLSALPLVIPSYVGGFLIVSALGPRGLVQQLLAGPFGVERLPEIYGFPGATLTLSLLSYPFILLTVRGALWRLDPALEETARSLGKGTLATFREVILPQLRPAIAAGSLLVALYTLSDFGAVSLLRYETFTWAIYLQYESALDRTVAAALSLVLVGLALGVLVVEALTRPAHQYYRSGAGVARPGVSVRLGRWRWLALGWCAAIVLLALGLPVLNLGYWLVRGVLAGEPLVFLWSLARNSIYVSGLAAMATLLAAAPVVALTVRYSGLLTRWLERITYIGFALPGIVVALALVFFGANYAFPLYQTTGLLVLAYVVLFLPTALGPLRASLLQVRPSVEEAGRGLGRSPFGVLLAVTLPLMRPGVVAGAALVFLVTMKELPATLILSPIGFNTLATSIWSATSEAFFAQAAAPALLLILASSVPMAFLALREPRWLR